MPEVDELVREGLRREVIPGDPAGVAERVSIRAARLRHRRRAATMVLAVVLVGGSVIGIAALAHAFGRAPRSILPATGTTRPGTAKTAPILFTGREPKTGIYGIYLFDPSIGRTRLVPGTGSVGPFAPAWSPDGHRIAFYQEAQRGIFVMALDGSAPRRITTFGLEPEWSPDGTEIAFFWSPEGAVHDTIWVVHPDGTGLRKLGPGSWPAWSPDGTHVVFATDQDQLEVMGSDGSHVQALHVIGIRAAWSPDGGTIAFSRDDGIYGMNPDGSHVRKLTHGAGVYEDPAWSPDGTRIAFSHGVPAPDPHCPPASACELSQDEVWVMNADGSGEHQLTRWASAAHPNGGTAPAWAPIALRVP